MRMSANASVVLIILALVCFLVGAIGWPSRINWIALGLFFWCLATELGKGVSLP